MVIEYWKHTTIKTPARTTASANREIGAYVLEALRRRERAEISGDQTSASIYDAAALLLSAMQNQAENA